MPNDELPGAEWPHGYFLRNAEVIDVRNHLGYKEKALFKFGVYFEKEAARWNCYYAPEPPALVEQEELIGHGETARAAFENLIWKWTMLNGGVESDGLKIVLPDLRRELDAHGFTA